MSVTETERGAGALERRRGSRPIGLVVDGRYIASTNDNGGASAFGLVFALVWTGLVMVMIAPTLIWGRRAYKQVSSDLGAPVSTTRGRYLGSWTWRGVTSRFFAVQRIRIGHISGFPVAIQERDDEVSWFAAPIELLSEVRHFEEAIARGTREVIVTYHPATRAIAKLQAADGSAELDLQRLVDELHPEAGLQLRVSRRQRKAHLPDF